MSGRKTIFRIIPWTLAVSLLASFFAVMLVSCVYSHMQFEQLNAICAEMLRQEPKAEEIVFSALKEYKKKYSGQPVAFVEKEDVLSARGYQRTDFAALSYGKCALFAAAGGLAGIALLFMTLFRRNQREAKRICALTDYLEQVNTGKAPVLSAVGEDDFSKLEDEIYKTVTFLYQTRDAAVQARNDFAQNLSNIAHQIKTPITAISLSVQMMKGEAEQNCRKPTAKQEVRQHHREQRVKQTMGKDYLEQVQKQVMRLTRLEEALLRLSQMDANALCLQKQAVDVFTLLVLAADNLQELCDDSHTSITVPELGEMTITADLDWTMEALMNLMKNCMEHGREGRVYCSYAQNPLYTEILIWDEGEGFAKEDLPHLFERFYRGKNAGEGSTGIGLALAREIIERQNGTIRAKNNPTGGACFEIHFYRY